jgi:CRP/FNR family cyclic AMP-dependent transcriptional regulator
MTMPPISGLAALPFLRGMSRAQLEVLGRACEHVLVPAGERLFEEGSPADRFWIIDAGQVALEVSVPGQGPVPVERLGRNDVLGLSWLASPRQWRFGAVATQPLQAYAFDARAVQASCDADPALGYELTRRFTAVVIRRLQATRSRLLDACVLR